MLKPYLLDTHILLWWLTDDPRLTPKLAQLLQNPNNLIYTSSANFWEISIKHSLGKLKLQVSLSEIISATPFPNLSIKQDHISQLDQLPPIHKDPFDRILIAQSIAENAM